MGPLALIALAAALLASPLLALGAARLRRERALARLWRELARGEASDAREFRPELAAALPPPAARWLTHAIAPGTPLRRVVLLRMHGSILLAAGKPPLPMVAEQVLSPPRGFVWKARVGRGLLRIRGFDRYARGTGELRWWALGVIPAATGSGRDTDRSAAGRLAGEATLVPAALLPGPGVQWEPVAEDAARAVVQVYDEQVAFTIRVRADGSLQQVVIDRWNGDPRNGPVGFLPFVVDFEGEQQFGGYTLPTGFSAGWASPGTLSVKPFFHARLDHADFR